ncbi:MAG: hypothetical protein U5Q03_18925 [Bacteroidota bacterium]|nr:hypothetical protein [Bacteroidota bacterium]
MPTNLLKKYPELLELAHLPEHNRTLSLKGVFKRDIEDNTGFKFRHKMIRPVKGEEPSMQLLFKHLTTELIQERNERGETIPKRIFEMNRSQRLHWIKYHIDEKRSENMKIFSIEERSDRGNVIRTYIYDIDQKYVIVLEPQRSGRDYYLLTAYYLHKSYGVKKMKKKLKKKLDVIY